MKFHKNSPPREYSVGKDAKIIIQDCGSLELSPDEQITFVTEAGGQLDVTRKNWGFYSTPSLNKRLPSFGLKPVLVKNAEHLYFILLLEKGKEKEFFTYLKHEEMEVVRWLDSADGLVSFSTDACTICESKKFSVAFSYEKPPMGEVRFEYSGPYFRQYLECGVCGHFFSRVSMDMGELYGGEYVDATYGGLAGIEAAFQRVRSLPPEKSDNTGRIKRINEFFHRFASKSRNVLDIGSGIGVFPHGMKSVGWSVMALDPDQRAASHLRALGIEVFHGSIFDFDSSSKFDLVTLNKVIEHVPDPWKMLSVVKTFLKNDGVIYVEVPDAEAARVEGAQREEFFVDHLHVFSFSSLSLLAKNMGLRPLLMDREREPSGKFTIWGFFCLVATE